MEPSDWSSPVWVLLVVLAAGYPLDKCLEWLTRRRERLNELSERKHARSLEVIDKLIEMEKVKAHSES